MSKYFFVSISPLYGGSILSGIEEALGKDIPAGKGGMREKVKICFHL